VRSLPTLPGTFLYLPKVGEGTPMTEEETRESLRRFLGYATNLIGAEARHLSLVLRTDLADGTKKAKYQQRPFQRYSLRNGYGVLEITFTPDRRILQMTSTCIPQADQVQRAGAGAGIRPTVTADQARERVTGQTFTYVDAAGNTQTFTLTSNDEINVRELVVYPRTRPSNPAVLEFHLAWEVLIGREPKRAVYLDAVNGEVIATTQFSAP
jgi:hypothetical protein